MDSLRETLVSSVRLLVALALVLVAHRPADAEPSGADSLRREVAEAAKSIKQFLKGRERDSIAVGAFTAGGTLSASAGPEVARLLVEELKKAGVRITTERDALKVEGRYLDADDKQTKLLAVKITFRIVNRRDEEQIKFEREVFGDATLPILFGISTPLPPKGNAKERDRQLRDGLDKPSILVEGTQVFAGRGSLYAIEVLVEQDGEYKERRPEIKDGLAFVSIQRGEKYAVRLLNKTDHEAAVTLAIDGINLFAFTEHPPKDTPPDSQVIVDPKSTVFLSAAGIAATKRRMSSW